MESTQKHQAFKVAIIVLSAAIIMLSVVCYRQYEKIELHNLMALQKSYYFMQIELVERSGGYDEAEWNRCVNYLLMTNANSYGVREGKFGDYNKVARIIELITKIDEEYCNEVVSLLRTLKLSWNTVKGQYGVIILEGDADVIIKRLGEMSA